MNHLHSKSIVWQTASASTCKCCGWTSCPAADTTVNSLYTDTCRCQGWGVDSADTVQHIHSRTAPRPIAGLWDTTYRRLDLHTGIHLMKTQRENQIFSFTCFFLIVLNVWHVAHMVAHTPPVWVQIFINLNEKFLNIWSLSYRFCGPVSSLGHSCLRWVRFDRHTRKWFHP